MLQRRYHVLSWVYTGETADWETVSKTWKGSEEKTVFELGKCGKQHVFPAEGLPDIDLSVHMGRQTLTSGLRLGSREDTGSACAPLPAVFHTSCLVPPGSSPALVATAGTHSLHPLAAPKIWASKLVQI